MAAFDIESVIKRGVERALNEPIINGKSVMEWAEIGIRSQEQKHGHWVFDPDGMDWNIPAWKCSECHCRNDNIPPNLEKKNPLRWSGSKFCPNCGAKMDEEVTQDG